MHFIAMHSINVIVGFQDGAHAASGSILMIDNVLNEEVFLYADVRCGALFPMLIGGKKHDLYSSKCSNFVYVIFFFYNKGV